MRNRLQSEQAQVVPKRGNACVEANDEYSIAQAHTPPSSSRGLLPSVLRALLCVGLGYTTAKGDKALFLNPEVFFHVVRMVTLKYKDKNKINYNKVCFLGNNFTTWHPGVTLLLYKTTSNTHVMSPNRNTLQLKRLQWKRSRSLTGTTELRVRRLWD